MFPHQQTVNNLNKKGIHEMNKKVIVRYEHIVTSQANLLVWEPHSEADWSRSRSFWALVSVGSPRSNPLLAQLLQSCLTLCNPWTVTLQAPLSMGFSRQEYWSGLPFLPPGDLLDPGIKLESPASPALQVDSLLLGHWGSGVLYTLITNFVLYYCS